MPLSRLALDDQRVAGPEGLIELELDHLCLAPDISHPCTHPLDALSVQTPGEAQASRRDS
jgi:hypothetical protein